MMSSLKRFPFVRLLIPYVLGAVAVFFFPKLPNIDQYVFIVLLVMVSLFAFIKSPLKMFYYEWIFGVLLFVLLFLLGWQRTIDQQHFINDSHFSEKDSVTAWVAFVEEEPSEKSRSWKTILTMRYVREANSWVEAKGCLIAYFGKDSLQTLPHTGDCILFFTPPDSISPTLNPYVFDYRNYLKKKGIAHRVYLSADAWQLVEGKAPFKLSRLALQWRSKILHILEESPLTEHEFGVAAAILLGYNDKLDSDIRQIYADTGAAHVLSVSGMHVGVVFLIINTLLAFLHRKKYGKIIKAILLFIFIWSYAFITGLSPAVLRAAVMISFVIFSNAFQRRSEIWNTIAASAFFLLIFNPNLLVDVGFQLSYAAVIAIVALQPKISNWFHFSTWLGRNVWDLMAVSLAAQIGTAPIAIFYFHRFPTWFMMTNLIVMPFGTLIIYTGTALLLLAFIPLLKTIFGSLLFFEIRFLHFSMEWIKNLPGAVIEEINLLGWEVFVIYVIIISLFVFFNRKTARSIYLALFGVLVFSCGLLFKNHQHQCQKEMVVFEAGKSPAIGFVKGRKMVLLTDSALMNNADRQAMIVQNYKIRKGIRDISFKAVNQDFSDTTIGLYAHQQHLWFQNIRVAAVHQRQKKAPLSFRCDYLLVREGRYGMPEDYLYGYHCNNILVDGSNSRKMIQLWRQKRDFLNQNIRILPQEGALVKSL